MWRRQRRIEHKPTKEVAIVVPLHNRETLTSDEEISLRHLRHYLGHHDKYFVMPETLEFSRPGFGIVRFDNRFFGSARAHMTLTLSPEFYSAFLDYRYMLMYQLDCLVFSDQLLKWCGTGLDYVGAPWVKHHEAPYAGSPQYENKVGNSGFALIKIRSLLRVLYSREYDIDPEVYWQQCYGSQSRYVRYINLRKRYLKRLSRFNNVRLDIARHMANGENNDTFIANRATHYYHEFRIASLETALRFSFECVPRYCFELTNHTLPFGCHAWPRYDRSFWEPYLLKA